MTRPRRHDSLPQRPASMPGAALHNSVMFDSSTSRPAHAARASTLQLPPGPWATVLDCLCAHFPGIPRAQWINRFAERRILDLNGSAIDDTHPYRTGMTVHYFRDVPGEPRIPFEVSLVHVDRDLVVADKPHFLPVVPAGRFARETLLQRLEQLLDNADLAPLHRIDRGTAGLVMFSANRETRPAYQALFRNRSIDKGYEAVAAPLPQLEFPLVRRSRLIPGEPFFRMCEVDGPANSESRIDVIEREAGHWRYALNPLTGRKHQLRVHMAALGAAIVNDGFYPTLAEESEDDFGRPLKLLARSLRFVDPVSGLERHFESQRTL